MKRILGLLIVCVVIVGCIVTPAEAVASYEQAVQTIVRATDQFEETIPAQSIMPLGDNVSLDSRETVSYNCTYTPRDASVKFGYIAPDGYFYGLSGSYGSINKGIRVSERGSYTLAIWNKSDAAVTVKGTVNY